MDPPPPYTPSSSNAAPSSSSAPQRSERNGIPPSHRRSMEDEQRPLPQGWVRQFDPKEQHQFFVDTRADPPRSIWHHPYDDEEYLNSLSPEERENITRLHRSVSLKDIEAESSEDEDTPAHRGHKTTGQAAGAGLAGDGEPHGLHKYTRRLKDRVTHSTHQQRIAERQRREEQERRAYRAHLAARAALMKALETGQPQYLGKDPQGREVFVEPPSGPQLPMGARGYNPYAQGPYANPNARFVRPVTPYGRPYGYGYGGGYGFPLLGGFLGGALLGGALF